MPFLDWSIVPKGGPMAPILWADNRHTPFNDIPIVPVKFKADLAKSAFAIDYYEEFLLAAMDSLNILYVAFTRAKQRLYGWAPLKTANSGNGDSFAYSSIGALMHAVAKSNDQLPDDNYIDTRATFDDEEHVWEYGEPIANAITITPSIAAVQHEQAYADWRSRLQVKFQALTNDDEGELVLPRKQGILLHEILGRLQHPSQLDTILTAVQREGWMDDYQLKKARDVLEDLLAMEALQPWNTGNYKRLAERNMINNQRQLRRPDLVLYTADETIVYDFKFTATDTDQEKHKRQINEYITMLKQMGFAQVKGMVIYGLEKKAIAV
jgi:ATP-dependent exoDNAse (exonuclease V) beta subunit